MGKLSKQTIYKFISKIILSIILFSNFIQSDTINELNNFINKSIFFSSLNTDTNFSLDQYKLDSEFQKPHKTDTVIVKLDVDNKDKQIQLEDKQNFLSIQIAHQFYKIFSCFNSKSIDEKTQYRYKNIFSNFVKISKDTNLCYKRKDYFDKDFTRKRNNIHIDLLNKKSHKQNEIDYEEYYSNFKIKDYLNINLKEYNEKITNFLSDFIMWNEFSYYELIFYYDKQTQIFNLDKIFIYYSIPSEKLNDLEKVGNYYFITLIKNGREIFDNIFIYYKKTQKIMRFTKNYKDTGKSKLTISDFNDNLLNYPIEISTRKNDSIFHNLLTIKLKSHLIENFVKTFDNQKNMKEICIFVYQHLTEDVYIEKNEMMNYLNKNYNLNKIEYLYSKFIDQELSSDLTEQYFVSFVVCDEIEKFRNSNDENIIELKYPIHFRYQPILIEENKTHQRVMMPNPYIDIMSKNNTLQVPELNFALFYNYFYSQNIFDKDSYFLKIKRNGEYVKDQFNERKIFYQEIQNKLKFVIHDYNFHISQSENLIHEIPAGMQRHFWIVSIITALITLIGFLIILYGLIIYSIHPNELAIKKKLE